MKSEFLIPNIDYEKLFLTTYYNENQWMNNRNWNENSKYVQ